ncbi:MAG TPA: 2OG-Fe(II) oxygenase [Sphingomonadaceae bacterium]
MNVPIIPPEPDHPDRERMRRLGGKVRARMAATRTATPLCTERAELWAVREVFAPAECSRLAAMIDAVAQPSRTYSGEADAGLRTSWSGVLDPHDSLVRKLQRRMDALLGFERSHGEMLQGQRYTAGQEFRAHTDWFPQASPGWAIERDNGGQRAFTAMVYLNDVSDGGETDFPRLDLAVAPRQGVMLVWNNADRDGVPNPFTVHAGNPVRSGTKYVVTRWYRCHATGQRR